MTTAMTGHDAARGARAESVLHPRARLGEGPAWDADLGALWWVDILDRRVHRFDPASGTDTAFGVEDAVGFAAPAPDGMVIVGLRHSLARLDAKTGSLASIVDVVDPRPGLRLNDGKCDPRGRLWFGTKADEEGGAALYRFDPDGTLRRMEKGLTLSNGLGWSPGGATFYLTDTPKKIIYAYEFDVETGTIGGRRVFADLSGSDAFPDGLAVDAEGGVWSAQFAGACVIRFGPDGSETHRIALPVPNPTSCAFGGESLEDLYVTSASVGLSEEQIDEAPHSGDLFRVHTGFRGTPVARFGEGLG